MATLSQIAVHPIKALDPVAPDSVTITDIGGLAGDRMFAIVDRDGNYVNGKRTAAVHRLRAEVDLETNRVSIGVRGGDGPRDYHLEQDRTAFEAWLSTYFDIDVELVAGRGGELTDGAVYGDGSKTGPTIVSRATLKQVASWYDGIDTDEMRLRMRPNLIVDGVPAFWEDRLVADGGSRVQIGDVLLEGVAPVPRCIVPARDPHTGEERADFRETFIEQRAKRPPPWAQGSSEAGELFTLTVVARIPPAERDGSLAIGDEVRILESTQAT